MRLKRLGITNHIIARSVPIIHSAQGRLDYGVVHVLPLDLTTQTVQQQPPPPQNISLDMESLFSGVARKKREKLMTYKIRAINSENKKLGLCALHSRQYTFSA